MMIPGELSLPLSLGMAMAVFIVYLLTFAMFWWRKRMRLSVIFYRGFLFAFAAAALCYTLLQPVLNHYNLIPFADWRRISELGYKAVWARAAQLLVPFMLLGYLLPMAFRKINRFSMVGIIALTMAVLFGVLRFLTSSDFDIDEVLYVMWGIMLGFASITFLAGMIPRLKLFASMKLAKSAYIIGVLMLMGTFFAGVGVLLLDNGTDFVELRMSGGVPLPENVRISASLGTDTERLPTYKLTPGDMNTGPSSVAQRMGMQGTIEIEGDTQSIAVIQDGNKTLTYYATGNWTYEDADVMARTGQLPNNDTILQMAEEIAKDRVAKDYEIYNIVVEDDEGAAQKEVWIYAAAGGKRVINACEFHIWVGASGGIGRVMRIDSDFERFKNVRTISSQDAYELLLAGGLRADGKQISIANTLYGAAPVEVNITQADLCYALEATKGILQPIWCFQAVATLPGGSSQPFEIYVPAIRY